MPASNSRPPFPANVPDEHRATALRLAVVWLVAFAFVGIGPVPSSGEASLLWAGAFFIGLFATILISAFGVVAQADRLALALGEPYGTLVLTFSIVVIEVVLIAAVMLGPGDAAGIGRDSIFSLLTIALNLVMGVCLVAGGLRNGEQDYNPQGAISYLSLVVVLTITALILPMLVGVGDGSFAGGRAPAIAVVILCLYGGFVVMQIGGYSHFFVQPDPDGDAATSPGPTEAPKPTPRAELAVRTGLLAAFVLPIVLLSGDLATVTDIGIGRLGAPEILGGILIATIVFTPEAISSIRAALANRFQRALNIGLGACLSTLRLTVPAILLIGHLTDQTVALGLGAADAALLAATVALTTLTFLGHRTSPVQGLAHLTLFAVFVILLF